MNKFVCMLVFFNSGLWIVYCCVVRLVIRKGCRDRP